MGNLENCCKSDATIDAKSNVDMTPMGGHDLRNLKLNLRQVYLLKRIQARVRGMITRKQVNIMRNRDIGMGNAAFGANLNPDHGGVDYENWRVNEIRQQLGPFNYLNSRPNTLRDDLEDRPMEQLENHAKFEG